jgi:CheY-like chemotaxis protein
MSDNAVILLVEDLEDDILLIQKAFGTAGLHNPIHVVRDGEEALAYLSGHGKYSRRAEFPLPDLILLDLKLPGMDGFEVLTWIRTQPGLRTLIVVVLTSSSQPDDVNSAFALRANSYLVKPEEFENQVALCKLVRAYWLQIVKGPEAFRPSPSADSGAGSN